MVSTLAQSYGAPTADAMADLVNQAFELASPIADYEEAAIQNGAVRDSSSGCWSTSDGTGYATAEELCNDWNYDPCDREVFEHWAVTDWFADKLIAAGEKVDKDFAGLCVWARTTTGQAIYADGVIERIYAETHSEAA
jgi:hypothetical protein